MSPDPTGRPSGGGFFGEKPNHHVPRSGGTIGMWLFLASLAMLFIASLIAYILIRHLNRERYGDFTVHLPSLLWVSSLSVIAVSITLGQALASVRRERQKAFTTWLKATLVFAGAFIVIQTPAMIGLLMQHQRLRAAAAKAITAAQPVPETPAIYGLIFVLILLHALHVVGGIVALGIVTFKGLRGGYDHEHFTGVRFATMYWHFLDAVWLIMFGTFLMVG